jgi:hypothetical protein
MVSKYIYIYDKITYHDLNNKLYSRSKTRKDRKNSNNII